MIGQSSSESLNTVLCPCGALVIVCFRFSFLLLLASHDGWSSSALSLLTRGLGVSGADVGRCEGLEGNLLPR